MIIDIPLRRPLAIYLIERSRVRVTALPDFIDGFRGLRLVSTIGPGSDGENSSASHTLLMLLRKIPLASVVELPGPPALSTQSASANLSAGCMPQIASIDFES